MVIKRTELPKDMILLKKNLREMMYPFTAMHFKESNKLKMKEILAATKNFGVRNLIFLSSNPQGNYLKLLRVPDGPSFHFKIKNYSLISDVVKYTPRNKNVNCS